MSIQRVTLKTLKFTLSFFLLLLYSTAHAGFVTLHETEVNSIFSQPSFGFNTIEVRYSPTQQVVNDNLSSIDNDDEIFNNSTGLFSLSKNLTSNLSIAMFFVDNISSCGGTSPSIVGCAARYTSTINGIFDNNYDSFTLFDSSFVSGNLGAHTIAHELGHVFGLSGHVGDVNSRDNLMNPVVASNSVTTLTTDQINTIFDRNVNALIQTDISNGKRFIEVSPIAILTSSVAAVPEPLSIWMLLIGLIILFYRHQKIS